MKHKSVSVKSTYRAERRLNAMDLGLIHCYRDHFKTPEEWGIQFEVDLSTCSRLHTDIMREVIQQISKVKGAETKYKSTYSFKLNTKFPQEFESKVAFHRIDIRKRTVNSLGNIFFYIVTSDRTEDFVRLGELINQYQEQW